MEKYLFKHQNQGNVSLQRGGEASSQSHTVLFDFIQDHDHVLPKSVRPRYFVFQHRVSIAYIFRGLGAIANAYFIFTKLHVL